MVFGVVKEQSTFFYFFFQNCVPFQLLENTQGLFAYLQAKCAPFKTCANLVLRILYKSNIPSRFLWILRNNI